MKYPKFLKENDKIAIPAPSAGAKNIQKINKYKNAIKFFNSIGFILEISKNLYNNQKGRSTSARKRGEELTKMWTNNEIDGLICAAGGEFLIECLPYIDFNSISKNPKIIAGFSDPTGILYTLTTKYDIATIYGSNFSHFGSNKLFKNDFDILSLIKGEKFVFESYPLYEEERKKEVTGLEPNNYTEKVEWKTLSNNKVQMKGRIIGGCLDIISILLGTQYDGFKNFQKKYYKDGIIWYFDNCELSMEEIIRILWKMNELNYFENCKGIIFGRFGINITSLEYDIKTCLEDSILNELKIPIIYDADISHKSPCLPILNGSIATINCDKGKGKIKFSLE